MRKGHLPGRITAHDHTVHLDSSGETKILHSNETYTLSRASLTRAALTASVTDRYTTPCGTKTRYCTCTRQPSCPRRRWHTVHFDNCARNVSVYCHTHKYRTFSPRRPASMRTGQTSPADTCDRSYRSIPTKYRIFSLGRPASMRKGHLPRQITALDLTGHLAPGGEPKILHSSEPATLSRAFLTRAYRSLPRAVLTASVTLHPCTPAVSFWASMAYRTLR